MCVRLLSCVILFVRTFASMCDCMCVYVCMLVCECVRIKTEGVLKLPSRLSRLSCTHFCPSIRAFVFQKFILFSFLLSSAFFSFFCISVQLIHPFFHSFFFHSSFNFFVHSFQWSFSHHSFYYVLMYKFPSCIHSFINK